MSECGQAYPEHITPRERNNWEKTMEHRPQEGKILRTTKLYSDFILATNTGNGVSRTQHKRMALAYQKWTPDGENAAQTDKFK